DHLAIDVTVAQAIGEGRPDLGPARPGLVRDRHDGHLRTSLPLRVGSPLSIATGRAIRTPGDRDTGARCLVLFDQLELFRGRPAPRTPPRRGRPRVDVTALEPTTHEPHTRLPARGCAILADRSNAEKGSGIHQRA